MANKLIKKNWRCLIFISWEPPWSPDLPYWTPQLRKHQSSCLSFSHLNFESTQNVNWEKSIDLNIQASSVQFSSVTQSCPTPYDPMDCSTPGFPIHHQLPEFTQTHVHQVSDAIQPSHPLSSPSSPTFNPSQHQGLFKWVSSSHQVAKVMEFQLQHQSFQWIFRTDLLLDGLVGSPFCPRDSQKSSSTTVKKHQLFGTQLSL